MPVSSTKFLLCLTFVNIHALSESFADGLARAENADGQAAASPVEVPEAVLVATKHAVRSPTETCDESTPVQTSTQAGVATSIATHGPCNYDNCLRQAIQSSGVVGTFCQTYTTAVQTSTTGYPGYVSMCNNSPSSISSACFCLATIAPAPPKTSTVGSAKEVSTTHQVHTVTDWVTTIIWVTPSANKLPSTTSCSTSTQASTSSPSAHSSTILGPSTSSISAQSHTTVGTSTSPPPAQSSTTHQTSSTPASSSVTPSQSSSSSSSSSTAPTSTGWVTLPASDAIKSCLGGIHCPNYYGAFFCLQVDSFY
jgi:hypothetical protein